jgi:peptidoglycan/xylan/chitin deacetylase (PgdA/CDA1 family)
LAGLRRWHKGEWTSRKPPVLVTFDDGYRNNLTIAARILQEEGVPALFFLATGFLGTPRVLWNDEVRVRVLHWPESEIPMPSGGQSALPSELHARRAFSDKVNQACKRLTEECLAEYLALLRKKTPSVELMDDSEAREFLSWDEARQLAGMGFEIGSHTVEHPILSRINRARVVAELHDSKAVIERELGEPCRAIAYPNGSVRDVNETVFEEVRAAGYEWAFMTTPVWQKAGGDPHRISRVVFPGHTDLATFKFYASGLHTRLLGGHE